MINVVTQMIDESKGVLLLSTGSKVAIARAASKAASKRGLTLHGSDCTKNVPTRHFVDRFTCFDTSSEGSWIEKLKSYCRENSISLVIPTRHADLEALANQKSSLAKEGICVAVSDTQTISICLDKLATSTFFANLSVPSPQTGLVEEAQNGVIDLQHPLFVKPRFGSAGRGIKEIESKQDLWEYPSDWIAQEKAAGLEYTINVYVSKKGKCICAIPHQRILTDGSESVQARTERIPVLINWAKRIVEGLPGAWGPLNIQCFYDREKDRPQFIEINPRLGGGFPLAHAAKGEFIEWLLQEAFEESELARFDDWTDQLLMMKYRNAIFDLD